MIKQQAIILFTLLLLVISTFSCKKETYIEKDFSDNFENINSQGTILILDNNEKQYTVFNKIQSETRLSPASTFKIYNSLFALETGVANDKNFEIEWSGRIYNYDPWNRTHTLESAIKNSVVWYFQEIARRIGWDRMNEYLNKLDYGNNSIAPSLDKFWLNGGLVISAKEQVDLLVKLYNLRLPFSKRAQKLVKEMIILESNPEYSLSGKTGLYGNNDQYYGWFVGYVESNNNVYFFATNIKKDITDSPVNYEEATILTKEILKELDIL